MNELSFKLDVFEGPLDLLLFLISKHKLNIFDIEIALLLEQYLNYIDSLSENDLESAGDFLEMAARLIMIKSLSLLPKHDEAEKIKKELEGRLIELSLCKLAASKLSRNYAGGDIFVRKPAVLEIDNTYKRVHSPEELLSAYMGLLRRDKKPEPLKAEVFRPIVSKKIYSVSTKIISVLRKLYKTGFCKMSELYDGIEEKSEKIATFLAVLELTKSGRIYLNDDNTELRFNNTQSRKAAQRI